MRVVAHSQRMAPELAGEVRSFSQWEKVLGLLTKRLPDVYSLSWIWETTDWRHKGGWAEGRSRLQMSPTQWLLISIARKLTTGYLTQSENTSWRRGEKPSIKHHLWVSFACIWLHNALFREEQNRKILPKFIEPVTGRVRIKTQICLTPNVTCFQLNHTVFTKIIDFYFIALLF